MDEPRLCRLQYVVGRIEPCPEGRCPFWELGGAVLPGRCAFEELDLSARPAVAQVLLRIRKTLEAADLREARGETRRLFYRLLNEGDGE